jgi:hypothetical protein
MLDPIHSLLLNCGNHTPVFNEHSGGVMISFEISSVGDSRRTVRPIFRNNAAA